MKHISINANFIKVFLSSSNVVSTGPTVSVFVFMYFRSFFQGLLLAYILASGSGSGTLLI